MPLLKISTNRIVENTEAVLQATSQAVAAMLGKPERYVMVELHAGLPMSLAGSSEPLAYLELKSIGLPEERTAEFSAALCRLIDEQLGIPAERIYIEFSDAPRHLWGWNGATF